MECRDVRQDLLPLLFDALEAPETDAIRLHLNSCAGCAARHANLLDLLGLLTGPQDLPPASAWQKLSQRITGAAHAAQQSAPKRPGPRSLLQLPGYTLLEKLGARRGVVVYRARRIDERPVVIRIYDIPDTAKENAMRTLTPPPHPQQVGIIDHGRQGPYLYEVVDYVEGHSLSQLLASGPLASGQVREILSQAARLLSVWHQAGRVHGAIRPTTLLWDRGETLHLLPPPPQGWLPDVGSLEVVSFLSPEQLRSQQIDGRSDLFALGVTAYTLLTGDWPWGRDPARALERLRAPRCELDCDIPCDDPELLELIEDLTQANPDFRLQDADELLEKLSGVNLTMACMPDSGFELPVAAQAAAQRAPAPASHRPESDDAQALMFKRYKILGVLGEGGMGTVYRAEHTMLKRERALKVVQPHLLGGPEARERFRREILLLSRLQHENIAQIFDAGQDDQNFYMAMELVEGQVLSEILADQGRFEVPRALDLAAQVFAALDAAHGKNIVHRDLKPENVMLCGAERDKVKLLDFGVARALESNEAVFQTMAGRISGTPAYMSPEQCSGDASDARSDLYAVGVMLFEMLTGRLPFQSRTPVGYIGMHLLQPAPGLREVAPDLDLPLGLEELVQKLLQKNKDDRFASASEVLEALAGLKRAAPPRPGFWSRLGSRLRRWLGR